MTFGEKLKQIRDERQLSQEAFAVILNTSKQVISRYERGETTPKIGVAAEWCKILGVNLDNMLNDNRGIYDAPTLDVSMAISSLPENAVSFVDSSGERIAKLYAPEQLATIRQMLEAVPGI